MPIVVPITDASAKSDLCAEIIAELPKWFGRPGANACYVREIAIRDCFAGLIDGRPRGLMAVEYHFNVTCNIWWLGVSPKVHRRGLGRALIECAAREARARGCRYLAVQTVSSRASSPEYEMTRRFYQAVGFTPFVEFEPEPADYMMWILHDLL